MSRRMSVAMTLDAVQAQTKTVTPEVTTALHGEGVVL